MTTKVLFLLLIGLLVGSVTSQVWQLEFPQVQYITSSNQTILVSDGTYLTNLNKLTGDVLWSISPPCPTPSAIVCSPSVLLYNPIFKTFVSLVSQVVTPTNEILPIAYVASYQLTGEVMWSKNVTNPAFNFSTMAIGVNGEVVMVGIGSVLQALAGDTGDVLFTTEPLSDFVDICFDQYLSISVVPNSGEIITSCLYLESFYLFGWSSSGSSLWEENNATGIIGWTVSPGNVYTTKKEELCSYSSETFAQNWCSFAPETSSFYPFAPPVANLNDSSVVGVISNAPVGNAQLIHFTSSGEVDWKTTTVPVVQEDSPFWGPPNVYYWPTVEFDDQKINEFAQLNLVSGDGTIAVALTIPNQGVAVPFAADVNVVYVVSHVIQIYGSTSVVSAISFAQ